MNLTKNKKKTLKIYILDFGLGALTDTSAPVPKCLGAEVSRCQSVCKAISAVVNMTLNF